MSKYEEDVYGRAEMKFVSLEKQIQWLSSFVQKGGNGYELAALDVAEQLAAAKAIREKVNRLKTVESLEELRTEAEDITVTKVKKDSLTLVDNRLTVVKRIEQESKLAREGATEKKLRSEIKSASTESEFASILRQAEGEVSDSAYNRLNDEVDKRLKQIRQEKAEVARLERETLARERKAFEKEEARLEKIKQEKKEEERKAEARRITEEGQARRAAEIAKREEREAEEARQRERDAERALRKAQEAIDRATEKAIEEALG